MTVDPFLFAARCVHGIDRRVDTYSVRRALQRHGIRSAHRIHTFTSREELEALYRLASSCPENARALEIGSYLGASTCFIAAGLRGERASMVCVDTWQNETMPEGANDTFAEFEKNVHGVKAKLTLVRKRSSDVSPAELGGPFALVFLDGDHSYRQTKADFELVAPLVTPTGTIAFHDARFWEGVSRVIGEAIGSGLWRVDGIVSDLLWITRADFKHAP